MSFSSTPRPRQSAPDCKQPAKTKDGGKNLAVLYFCGAILVVRYLAIVILRSAFLQLTFP